MMESKKNTNTGKWWNKLGDNFEKFCKEKLEWRARYFFSKNCKEKKIPFKQFSVIRFIYEDYDIRKYLDNIISNIDENVDYEKKLKDLVEERMKDEYKDKYPEYRFNQSWYNIICEEMIKYIRNFKSENNKYFIEFYRHEGQEVLKDFDSSRSFEKANWFVTREYKKLVDNIDEKKEQDSISEKESEKTKKWFTFVTLKDNPLFLDNLLSYDLVKQKTEGQGLQEEIDEKGKVLCRTAYYLGVRNQKGGIETDPDVIRKQYKEAEQYYTVYYELMYRKKWFPIVVLKNKKQEFIYTLSKAYSGATILYISWTVFDYVGNFWSLVIGNIVYAFLVLIQPIMLSGGRIMSSKYSWLVFLPLILSIIIAGYKYIKYIGWL
ncbi:hypothetical protein [Conchiformibius steedae]|uniref:Uncharacterized protein n=1 Tax=Conchiformibius steedae TaxID=153493 RepID=A0A3P2A5E1_9NEIS|nr:hypothetical protein [Conchiformibius steedae]RRD90589.1 hypothetical protein EII21_04765 [Conchiformibius steedae]